MRTVESSTNGTDQVPDGPVTEAARRELATQARRYTVIGLWLIATSVVATIVLMAASWIATGMYVEDLQGADDPTQMLVLLLARGTAFGATGLGTIAALLLFARACMDQSARFRKRWFSAPVFNQAMRLYTESQGEMSSKDVIRLFEAWNAVVDSPFADIRLRNKPQNVSVDMSRGRFFIGEDSTEAAELRDLLGRRP